jgi:NAD(P)-dependent dehydrogenase (short-subunit alcohol dehydrogenase family)
MDAKVLAGKTALVTAASQGIGLASARALAEDGATVVIMGRREDVLAKARDRLLSEVPGARIEMFAGDATDEMQVKAVLAFAHGLAGRLDIIASVTGNPTFKPLLMREAADVREEFELNFMSAFLAVRHGVPLMEPGGVVVCVSSAGATQTSWGLSIYGSAKAALERFVRAAAFELGGAGIRVNAVRPGLTLSPARAAAPELAPMVQHYVAETPLGRVGDPADVARVVRFLAGPESGWVTGQTFSADGGLDQGKGPDPMDAMYGKDMMDRIRAGKPDA